VDIKNRMQTHPDQTIEMDVFGLRKRNDCVLRLSDEQPTQEDAMRYVSDRDVVLNLKDKPSAPKPPDQSQNWEEVRRLLMEAARKIDPTYTISEQEALCARLIADMMRQTATPRSTNEYLVGMANAGVAKAQREYQERVAKAATEEAIAVPMNKRTKWGYQRVF